MNGQFWRLLKLWLLYRACRGSLLRRLSANTLSLLLGHLILPRLEGRGVCKLFLLDDHQKAYATFGIWRNLETIELQGDALLADAEKAADSDHEAFDVLSIFAENEIADAADLRLVGSKNRLAYEVLAQDRALFLHQNLYGNR